ncbi:hypothetical protein EJ07DRAFT_166838 [Lizonia empirigonia]|nr:hypothetical protein EJ07DRAFT_166838 [Lizonia empirigonia]
MAVPSNKIDSSARLMAPTGLPLAIIIIASISLGLSLVTVSMRTYIRLRRGIFSLDDAFMTIGTIVYMPVVSLAIYGCLVGLGRLNEDLNAWQQVEAVKYYLIWIFVGSQSSVCITIRRIASIKRPLRITVWVLLAVAWASFLVTFLGTLLYCQPVRSLWTLALIISGEDHCAPADVFLIIAHTATVSTILTDMALVIVPAIILWNTQMKRQSKIQAFGLLSFASLASIITIVRIPFYDLDTDTTTIWVSHIVLCLNVETGIGCFASSIPSLRHFFQHERNGSSGNTRNRHVSSGNKFLTARDDIGLNLSTVHHARTENTWERLHDAASDKSDAPINLNGIYAKRSYAVDVESA